MYFIISCVTEWTMSIIIIIIIVGADYLSSVACRIIHLNFCKIVCMEYLVLTELNMSFAMLNWNITIISSHFWGYKIEICTKILSNSCQFVSNECLQQMEHLRCFVSMYVVCLLNFSIMYIFYFVDFTSMYVLFLSL